MGIIAKSELRQNYRIAEDELRRSRPPITVAPSRRRGSGDSGSLLSQPSRRGALLLPVSPGIKHGRQTRNHAPLLRNAARLALILFSGGGLCRFVPQPFHSSSARRRPRRGLNQIDKDKNPPPATSQGEWSHLVDSPPRAHHSHPAAFTTQLIIIHILCARAP